MLNNLAKMATTRRLAAILAADVAGYSRLIGADEQGTLMRLRVIRTDLIEASIAANNGRIVKTTGDGFLAEFGSSVEALYCAGELQRRMAESNAELPADRRIDFRIGIHQGDIVVEDGDIFGDGVNIAARLEGLAEPAGICVSARVQEDAAGKLDLGFHDLGEQQLKNIARPIRAYAVDAERSHFVASNRANPMPRISLIVLPFTSLSSDPEQEYLADAITDDLTTDLARFPDSFVIARTTAFTYKRKAGDVRRIARDLGVRYALEGSVRRLGEGLQVNVQLLDGETGSHVWADRFDSDRSDPTKAQREIVVCLTSTLTLELIKDAGRRIEQEHAAAPEPRDLVLRATALRLQTSIADRQARRTICALLERALILDPQSVEARIQLAFILVTGVTDAYSTSIEQDKARAETLISEALAWDPHNSEAHRIIGQLRRTQGRWAESQVHLETAVALDPYNIVALRNLGLLLRAVGKPEAAIPHLEKVIRIEVDHRRLFHGYTQLGNCHVYLGHTDQAIEFFRRARALAPEIWYVHLCLAGALGLRGEIDEAKREIAEALKLKPEVNSIMRWRAIASTQGFNHPQNRAMVEKTTYTGLRLAGFPEE